MTKRMKMMMKRRRRRRRRRRIWGSLITIFLLQYQH
jgi:hypothetical protein